MVCLDKKEWISKPFKEGQKKRKVEKYRNAMILKFKT